MELDAPWCHGAYGLLVRLIPLAFYLLFGNACTCTHTFLPGCTVLMLGLPVSQSNGMFLLHPSEGSVYRITTDSIARRMRDSWWGHKSADTVSTVPGVCMCEHECMHV